MSYMEKLKHPLWQRKRLEVLSAAKFTCERCEAEDKPLHVHHTYYAKGLEPWEYPADSLHALCEECHKEAQSVLAHLHREIGNLSLEQIEDLVVFLGEPHHHIPKWLQPLEPKWLPDLTSSAKDVLWKISRVYARVNRSLT